jgi:WD40 repeat protein
MKNHNRAYVILFGCVIVIGSCFLPWFSRSVVVDSTISGFQMWRGSTASLVEYAPRIAPELFALLWLLPLAALLTVALGVLEIFNKTWERQWVQLEIYGTLWLVMGFFICPAMTASKTNWGLWLCLAGWLLLFVALCAGISFERKKNVVPIAVSSSWRPTRRELTRGLIDLVAFSSLGLGSFLMKTSIRHQWALFTYRYHDPTTGFALPQNATNWIIGVSWSPTGKRILVGQMHAPVQSWDALTGGNIFTYQPADAVAATWSPDGQHIVLSDPLAGYIASDALIIIVDAATGVAEAELQRTDQIESIAGLAWSPDGQYIAVGTQFEPIVQLWHPPTGKMGKTYAVPFKKDAGISGIGDLAWSPDGLYLAAAVEDADLLPDGYIGNNQLTPVSLQGVYIWHVQNGDLLLHYGAEVSFGSQRGMVLSWSPDGKRLAFANKTAVQILDLALQVPVLTYTGHASTPTAIAWSPDGKHLASSSWDWTVQVWDASTGALRFLYQGHTASVNDVAWSPDGKYLASGGDDGTVQVWQPDL